MSWFYLSSGLIILVAIFHSVGGEKVLIGPLLGQSEVVPDEPLARPVLRFGWHSTTLFMLLTAILLASSDIPIWFKAMTGGMYVLLGIANGIMTKGKHPGWVLLGLAGILAFAGVVS